MLLGKNYFTRIFLVAGCVALLAACGGNYQAPVSEQGRVLDISAPEIISSSSPRRETDLSQPSTERRIQPPEISASSPSPNAAVSVSTPAPREAVSESITRSSAGRGIGRRVGRTVTNTAASTTSAAKGTAGTVGNAAAMIGSHLVRAGDTLFSIAFQYDMDFRDLALANSLQPPYTIFVGQELNLAANAANQLASVIDTVGTPVSGNGAARSRATNGSSGGVIRQPIAGSVPLQPSWNWPHSGMLLNRYTAGVSKGIDIAGNVGDPVLAASSGDVVYSGRGVQGSDNLIIIRHSDRYLSAYAHNSAMLVPEGTHVEVGQKIAEVGVNPAGEAMLHFEIRRDGQAIDPLQYLPAR